MDAPDRAELDALRRRAYGPGREALQDEALARLIELEDRLRAETVTPPDSADAGAASDIAARQPPAEAVPEEPSPGVLAHADAARDSAAPRRRTVVAAVVAVAAVVGALVLSSVLNTRPDDAAAPTTPPAVDPAGVAARAFVDDPETRVVSRVPLDGSFGNYIDLPASTAPSFPGHSEMTWAAPLGNYYGYALWIAGTTAADGPEHCILIDRDGPAASRCIPTAQHDQGGLLVSIPFETVPRDRRPGGMTAGERLAYWWGPDNAVTILVGPIEKP